MAMMRVPSQRLFELYIARVPWTLATKDLKDYFAQFGTIRKCLLPFDKETGFHKGVCWIGYSSEEGLRNVLQKESHILEGVKLQVQEHKPRSFRRRYANEGAADMS
ncbi:SRA stem-loop-interacting RNA-binding protein, mitochondrial [Malaclemys terrapin pileata]|uniref:SRA stem-loop-interacting RNA-binding protein, mitochondrial n=1 Tax=Malaclemys terrapin pileata TaxID=2991368 RepID=UPI0023A8DE03|nr:SRA stem-loop-interacting RNA-binding protein, mitochondrial [Malaclemys terrapin pileata]